MTELKNDRYLRALLRQPVDVTPVWMMRQAGRYLPEYRATRAKAGDFVSLMKNPELACEVTIQPLDRYPQLDAAILFSDILTIPDAMGQGLYFETGEGPRFKKVVSTLADIEALPIPDPHKDLGYVMDAAKRGYIAYTNCTAALAASFDASAANNLAILASAPGFSFASKSLIASLTINSAARMLAYALANGN